jgi:hypothetical protein
MDGYTENEMNDYFAFVDNAYDAYVSSGNDMLLRKAMKVTSGNYGRRTDEGQHLPQGEPERALRYPLSHSVDHWILNMDDKCFSCPRKSCISGSRTSISG